MEGAKNVLELLDSDYDLEMIFVSEKFLDKFHTSLSAANTEIFVTKIADLERIGSFKTNNSAVAVAQTKPNEPFDIGDGEWILALDEVRDPGNLGTIMRIADWYGFEKLLLSPTCADFYNPKVINSSMGSFARINWYQSDLLSFLAGKSSNKYGAVMKGENLHEVDFPPGGILFMGNESIGLNEELQVAMDHNITIPKFGRAESLNVASATAVICDAIRRTQV